MLERRLFIVYASDHVGRVRCKFIVEEFTAQGAVNAVVMENFEMIDEGDAPLLSDRWVLSAEPLELSIGLSGYRLTTI